MLGDVIGQFIAETVLYQLGRISAAVVLPHMEVEPILKSRSHRGQPRTFTFERNGKRFLYLESVQLLGVITLLALGLIIFLGFRYLV